MERTLVINGQLDGLNEYTRACRRNRYAGAKMKSDNEKLVGLYIGMQMKDLHFPGKVTLNFKWFEPNRRRDVDNIAFAKKFILDALVKSGVIEADGQKYVTGFTDEFFVDKEFPRIEVTIREVDGNGMDTGNMPRDN